MPQLKPGVRVVSADDDADNRFRLRGTVLAPYVAGAGEEPGYRVQWDGLPEPMEELAIDLVPDTA
jgi:hypothetical protein